MNILNEQIKGFLEEPDLIASFSNISACIMMSWENLNWAGFYFVKNGELVLGPFQGKPACTHIPFTKGVCGKTYRTAQPQRVDDVLAEADHIACDAASRSELCVPIIVNGKVVGEIDLDAPIPSRFSAEDEKIMSQAADDIASAWLKHDWCYDR